MNDRSQIVVLKKTGRYLLYTAGALLGLLLIIWIVLLIYVNNNEGQLIRKVSQLVQKRTKGEVQVKGLSVSFFRTFPMLSLQLKGVVIRDSLYARHKKDLLNAENIYLRASIPGLIARKVPVGKIIMRNGQINLFTDTAGNTNEYTLSSGKEQKADESFEMPDFELRNVEVSMRNLQRNKHYQAHVRALNCSGKKKKEKLVFGVNMKLLVKNVAFNTKTGSYLRDIPVAGKFDILYSVTEKEIQVPRIRMSLAGHDYQFDGFFNLDKKKPDFRLKIVSNSVNYKQAASLLREPLEKKLKEYSISEPINLQVEVSGKTAGGSQPLVHVTMHVVNATVGTPLGSFNSCSFEGTFSNEMIKGKGISDENSLIHLNEFSGKWEQILVKSKNIKISNLTTPYLECDLKSDVDLKSLNTLTGSTSLQFLEGKSSIDVFYKGPVMGKDSVGSTITGEVGIYDASIKYLPRNFALSNCEGKLIFKDNDLEVAQFAGTAGKTQLKMTGAAKNFLTMLNKGTEKAFLTWMITSPAIHLEDFKSFLSPSKKQQQQRSKAKFGATASKIDKLFAEGEMMISVRTPQMDYKTFKATDVVADVILGTDEIVFNRVELKHAGGSMAVSGSLTNGALYNPVTLNAELNKMNIPSLFAAFDNFGQDAITKENLNGKISANVNFKTAVDNQAKLVSEANEGTVDFVLEDGELKNFEPLQKISDKAFKKQNFEHIRFADLENRLEVHGTAFVVNKMDIRSTALNLTVEGIYDIKKGTDMSIRLPVSNLTKSQADTDISDDGKMKKGLGIRLRARTGDDGKLNVSWDPFGRAKKKKEEVQDSTSVGTEE